MAQRHLVNRAIEELADSLPDIEVDEEEELQSASLIVKAVEIGLRCVMLDNEWSCVGDNTFIDSRFGHDDERTPVCALNVQLQTDIADGCLFLISPEGLRFNRLKISDIVTSDNMSKFACGEKIEVQNLVNTCFVIPSLCEGHLIGVSKLLPTGENFERLEQLWILKHGVALLSSHFAFIQLAYSGWTKRQWFPSGYVLQGLGFSSAPQSVRTLKAVSAFESFTIILKDWNFFSDGVVKVKESCVPGIDMECPVWETAGKCMGQFSSKYIVDKPLYEVGLSAKDLFMTLDFRTPKPDRLSLHIKETKDTDIEHAIILSMAYLVPNKPDYCNADMMSLSPQMPPSLVKEATGPATTYSEVKLQQVLIPSFTKRKPREAHKGLASLSKIFLTSEPCFLPITNFIIGRISILPSKLMLLFAEVKRQQVLIPSFTKGGEREANGDLTSPRSNNDRSIAENKKNVQPSKKDDPPEPKGDMLTQSAQSDLRPKFKYQKEQENIKSSSNIYCSTDEGNALPKPEDLKASRVGCLPDQGNASSIGPQKETLEKKQKPESEKKIRRDGAECVAKMKEKMDRDPSEIIEKVINYQKRGELQSLTVPDLKSFLSSRKSKVGGKKEELIQRVIALLG